MSEYNQKAIKTVLIIIVILIAGYFLYEKAGFLNREPKLKEAAPKNVITPQIIKIADDKLQKETPEVFSKEIPLNGKTKIVDSYSATYPNSTAKQSTITFESKNTSKQNYDFYLKWAKDNKWEVINQSNGEKLKSLYLRKGNEDLNIAISDKVTISYIEV